jgi:AcrR family transcriptional regulator
MHSDAKQRRTARHLTAVGNETPGRPARRIARKTPITVDRVVDAALTVVAAEGYDSLTVRRVAAVLETGPASLYAHVVNMADLDELLIGRLCSQLDLPVPDPTRWKAQILNVYAQLRDMYLRYPGISRAAMAMAPINRDTLRVNEGMLAILISAGIAPQAAAWAIDAMTLYVSAYAMEQSIAEKRKKNPDDNWVLSRDELRSRFTNLPDNEYPHSQMYATELTSGEGHERFDFTLRLIIDNLPIA